MSVGLLIALGVAVAAAGVVLGRLVARQRAQAWTAGVRHVVEAIRAATTTERAEILRTAEISARDEARGLSAAFDTFCHVREAELRAVEARAGRRTEEIAARTDDATVRRQRVDAGKARAEARESEARGLRDQATAQARAAQQALEQRAGETPAAMRATLTDNQLEDARL